MRNNYSYYVFLYKSMIGTVIVLIVFFKILRGSTYFFLNCVRLFLSEYKPTHFQIFTPTLLIFNNEKCTQSP